jgi:hypothetical protein
MRLPVESFSIALDKARLFTVRLFWVINDFMLVLMTLISLLLRVQVVLLYESVIERQALGPNKKTRHTGRVP